MNLFHICTSVVKYDVSLSCHFFTSLVLILGLNVSFYESSMSPQDLSLVYLHYDDSCQLGFEAKASLYFL